ncbi:unnamed protein product [Linum trigynum]|uniref:Gnk2-homologous domain-containing protein n=1 Tax=Linum trigynum TaxID=586398 RepID=A0AAV2EP29_9ROSI
MAGSKAAAVYPSPAATLMIVLMATGIICMQGLRAANSVWPIACSSGVDPAVTPCARKLAANFWTAGYKSTVRKTGQCAASPKTAVYGEALCHTRHTCGGCLRELTAQLFSACPLDAIGGHINNSDCSFRFEIYPFFLKKDVKD